MTKSEAKTPLGRTPSAGKAVKAAPRAKQKTAPPAAKKSGTDLQIGVPLVQASLRNHDLRQPTAVALHEEDSVHALVGPIESRGGVQSMVAAEAPA